MKKIRLLATLILSIWIVGCALRPIAVVKNGALKNYKYIFISPIGTLTSGSGSTIGFQYYSSNKSINPADIITGRLIKEGFIRLPELKNELTDETLIVNYGESGRRSVGLGYAIEVTMQFVSAKSNELICSCTAEGKGETEADDIRKAIMRCLSGLFLEES